MAKKMRHTEETWESDGVAPARMVSPSFGEQVITGLKHVVPFFMAATYTAILMGLMMLVGLGKMTAADMINMTKLVSPVFVVAFLVLGAPRLWRTFRRHLRSAITPSGDRKK